MVYIIFTALLAIGTLFMLKRVLPRSRRNTPPGPTPLPVIGNTHQMPSKWPWLVFSEWSKNHGGIIHLDVAGQPIVVINSAKVAEDLLDKRSAIYSDRPPSVMAAQLVGFGRAFALQHYGDKWRKQRRMVSQGFSISKVPNYYAIQEKEASTLVLNLLRDPGSLFSEISLRTGMIIIRILYGYPVKSSTDEILRAAMDMMDIFNKTTNPGSFMVDSFPSLRYLPRWMPGASFLGLAETWRTQISHAARKPYDWCKANLDSGKALMPNLCGAIIQEADGDSSEEDQNNLIWASMAMMGGGLDTNASTFLSFMMAMIIYPDIQKKAHAELDAVVGIDRLPCINDRPKLPYIRSIVAEVLRWAPAAPLGVPHALSDDDLYEGYHFTKGTMFISNIWHMLHDPEIYPFPEQFKPERFNGDDGEMDKVSDLVFGFGRRACPGRHFANGTLFATVATTLATCNILPELDEQGKEVLPKYAFTNGTVSFPEKFTLRLTPRSAQASVLLSKAGECE